MEATSARYAARDRWAEAPASQLLRFIQGACSPENIEPNLALNLEVADLINSKKGVAPREAALAIVGYINHRNPNVALLALGLLDICVKNCGYPFHLQISTKDFLNELVRRFPERPPLRQSRVQAKILEAIEEWRSTICETSRYKQDLGFVRDMHRLLSYKGYSFPQVRTEDVAVLNPSDNLKSAEEMEEEEREAQSAKLQELIRRGTPEDLQEANRLMKIMAGYDIRSKTDYRAKAAEEVAKVQAKARLLEQRLETFRPDQGDRMEDNDVFGELAAALRSAQPKIQKMCEEESQDHEAVAKLLEINDNIHTTVKRYELMRKGDLEAASKIPSSTVVPATPFATASGRPATHELSLIDFDVEQDPTDLSSAPEVGGTGLENDLFGLRLGSGDVPIGSGDLPLVGDTFVQGGGISLACGTANPLPFPAPDPPFTSSPSFQTSAPEPPRSQQPLQSLPWFKLPGPSHQDPGIGALPSVSNNLSGPAASADGSTSRDNDEWSFSSALPPESHSAPSEQSGVVNNTDLKIEFVATRAAATSPSIHVLFSFTNNTALPITKLHHQLAVTKGFELQLKPQTGRILEPCQKSGVTQSVEVWHTGDRTRKVESIRLRWKVTYKVGEEDRADSGEVAELKVA